MAGPSKNSRGSRSDSKARGNNSQFRTLIPVGAGAGAYVFNPSTGKNPRLAVDSPEFADALAALAADGLGEKIRAELVALHEANPAHGWDKTLARLDAAGTLNS